MKSRSSKALENKSIAIDLTKKQIEDSPLLEDDAPVSRYTGHALHMYFGWPLYWVPTTEQGTETSTYQWPFDACSASARSVVE